MAKLPAFKLVSKRDRSQVMIRAMAKGARWQQPDRYANWIFGHQALPGEIGMVQISQYGDKKRTTIEKISVREELRRGGLGTKLYEAAARAACEEFAQPLSSDYKRSAPAQAFWEKQLRKGRAVCLRKGRMSRDDRDSPPERSIVGRGGCGVYILKSCPAPKTLAGRR